MSKINTLPSGLQEYLGNTAMGVNPAELGQEVRPTISLHSFYDVPKMRTISATNSVAVPQGGSTFTIPEGEIWKPVAMSARMGGLLAGETVAFVLEVWSKSTNQRTMIASSQKITSTDNLQQYSFGYEFRRDTWFPAGFQFAVIVSEFVTAGPRNVLSDLIYIRAKI